MGLFGKKQDDKQLFEYTVVDGTATICGFNGKLKYDCLEIPQELDGYTVTSIGNREHAVFDRNKLKTDKVFCFGKVVLPKTLTCIGENAFRSCEIGTIEIPSSVKIIGFRAFAYCKVDNITIPEGVEHIKKEAFSNFGKQKGQSFDFFVLPDGLKSIGTQAFDFLSANTIVLPTSLTEVCCTAFWHSSARIFYKGNKSDLVKISRVQELLTEENIKALYLYAETVEPEDRGLKTTKSGIVLGFWHYVNGKPQSW